VYTQNINVATPVFIHNYVALRHDGASLFFYIYSSYKLHHFSYGEQGGAKEASQVFEQWFMGVTCIGLIVISCLSSFHSCLVGSAWEVSGPKEVQGRILIRRTCVKDLMCAT
jgi:hypothetical protein